MFFDLLANIVFCILLSVVRWETHIYESLGRSLKVCCADVVVSQLEWCTFVLEHPTDIMRQTLSQIQEVELQRTTVKQIWFVEFCLFFVLYSPAQSRHRIFL